MCALIQILDYGSGNLFSITKALKKVAPNILVRVSQDYKAGKIDGLILPGVGSFTSAQEILDLCRKEILEDVQSGLPVLGICLGMQLMFEKSEEGPGTGLRIFQGKVVRFRKKKGLKVPHMGWNRVNLSASDSKFSTGLKNGGWAYFAHSYYPLPKKSLGIVLGKTSVSGISFPSIIERENVVGTQYHPEKSGEFGQKLLGIFADSVTSFGKARSQNS